MNLTKSKKNTIYYLIALFLSIYIGNIVLDITDNFIQNIWIPRILGTIACALMGLLFQTYWLNKHS